MVEPPVPVLVRDLLRVGGGVPAGERRGPGPGGALLRSEEVHPSTLTVPGHIN